MKIWVWFMWLYINCKLFIGFYIIYLVLLVKFFIFFLFWMFMFYVKVEKIESGLIFVDSLELFCVYYILM